MSNPSRYRIIDGALVYNRKLKRVGNGLSVAIPIDAARELKWDEGDELALELRSDGIIVTRMVGGSRRRPGRPSKKERVDLAQLESQRKSYL